MLGEHHVAGAVPVVGPELGAERERRVLEVDAHRARGPHEQVVDVHEVLVQELERARTLDGQTDLIHRLLERHVVPQAEELLELAHQVDVLDRAGRPVVGRQRSRP